MPFPSIAPASRALSPPRSMCVHLRVTNDADALACRSRHRRLICGSRPRTRPATATPVTMSTTSKQHPRHRSCGCCHPPPPLALDCRMVEACQAPLMAHPLRPRRCVKEKGEGSDDCTFYQKAYWSLCPNEWVRPATPPVPPIACHSPAPASLRKRHPPDRGVPGSGDQVERGARGRDLPRQVLM